MHNALLGYTGFVGSHIRENLNPAVTDYFNSGNISEIVDQTFDTVYCACVPAVKWKANANPDEDSTKINTLKRILTSVKCRTFFLVSTIDVHNPEVLDQAEDNVVPSKEAYGKNRYNLEVQLREHFRDKLIIVRLPAVFGVGLNNNYMYDLMHDNEIDKININSAFQWYSLSWLWEDMETALDEGRQVVNLYSESIETGTIVATFFPNLKAESFKIGPRWFYSQSSNYGGRSKKEVLIAIDQFLAIEKMKTSENSLVASNMAWRTEHNEHAAFLMQRYGIKNIEILPTKFCNWEEVFQGNLQEELEVFRRYDISVYSVQAAFHGVQGKFGDDNVEIHMKKVVNFCEKVGAQVLVIGSPTMRGKSCDRKALADLLGNVQANTNVKICLEPNSSVYRCHVGTTLDACSEVRGSCHSFWLNYDTGNAYMEKDRLPEVRDRIGHVQIGNALLKPMKKSDYERLVGSGMCGAMIELLQEKHMKVSLEVNMFDNVKLLGEQIRRFSRFYRTYFFED